MNELFFNLIQISIGTRKKLSRTPAEEEWDKLLRLAIDQTLAGIMYEGLAKLPEEQFPPKKVLVGWHSVSEKIAADNRRLNYDTVWVYERWKRLGYHNVVLKGQGNATLYPTPSARSAGDVDVWVDGNRYKIADYILKHFPDLEVTRLEMEFPVRKETVIEVHFTPNFLYDPFSNRKLQRYFKEQLKHTKHVQLPDGEIEVPNTEMNLVFQLTHIYRHLFAEGIGLRQLLDYYYLLQQPEVSDCLPAVRTMLKALHLNKFAAALMWVLKDVFLLADSKMIVTPNEKEGLFLLKEIMQAGNFGHADERVGDWAKMNRMQRLVWGQKWSLRLLKHHPREVFWHPFYRIAQYFWRLRHGYLGKKSK